MLNAILKSKTRQRLLIKFFVNIANTGYLNDLASEFDESTNSVRKELNNLTHAKYLTKKRINNKVIYRANKNHPLFYDLQKIVKKYLGIEDIISVVLNRMGNIEKMFLLGDYANGLDNGQIEVLLVGNNINQNYLKNIEEKLEKMLNRKVIFIISNKDEIIANKLLIFSI